MYIKMECEKDNHIDIANIVKIVAEESNVSELEVVNAAIKILENCERSK